MKTEITISKIKQELISMFATLDAWLDRLLDDGFDLEHQPETREEFEHILSCNASLLGHLPDAYDSAMEFLYHDFQSDAVPHSLDELRFALRDQLFQALCLADYLDESTRQDLTFKDKQMDQRDKLLTIVHHLRHHLELLEGSEAVERK